MILEAKLIKKYQPKFNVRDKDDKSFLYVEITDDKFPRVVLTRGKELQKDFKGTRYGPFISTSSIREGLRIIRKIFPYSLHPESEIAKGKPCFNYQIGLCPGVCAGIMSRGEYLKNISHLKLFLSGKKKKLLKALEREMKFASREERFEDAEIAKRQIFSLKYIQDIAFIAARDENFQFQISDFQKPRIEGYDISNISGTSAVGSMVVFMGERPDKSKYRKFKIRTVFQSDDVGMLKEVLRRRFKHFPTEKDSFGWALPNLILIDGGKPQVNAAKQVLDEVGLRIPIVGIAKGPARKKNEFIGKIPENISEITLIRVRDEAHRFAVSFHRKMRNRLGYLKKQ